MADIAGFRRSYFTDNRYNRISEVVPYVSIISGMEYNPRNKKHLDSTCISCFTKVTYVGKSYVFTEDELI